MESGAQSVAASVPLPALPPLNTSAGDYEPFHLNAVSPNGHVEHAAEELSRQEIISASAAVNGNDTKQQEETQVKPLESAPETAKVCNNRC